SDKWRSHLQETRPTSSGIKTLPSEAPTDAVAEIEASVRLALDDPVDSRRPRSLLEAAGHLTAEQIPEAMERVARRKPQESYDILRALAGRWAQLDPAAAAGHVSSFRGEIRSILLR